MNSKPLAHFIDPRLLRDYYQLTKPKVVVNSDNKCNAHGA